MAQQGYGQPPYGAPPPPGGVRPPGAPAYPAAPGYQQQQPGQYPQYGAPQPGAPGMRPAGPPMPNGVPPARPPQMMGGAPPAPAMAGAPRPAGPPMGAPQPQQPRPAGVPQSPAYGAPQGHGVPRPAAPGIPGAPGALSPRAPAQPATFGAPPAAGPRPMGPPPPSPAPAFPGAPQAPRPGAPAPAFPGAAAPRPPMGVPPGPPGAPAPRPGAPAFPGQPQQPQYGAAPPPGAGGLRPPGAPVAAPQQQPPQQQQPGFGGGLRPPMPAAPGGFPGAPAAPRPPSAFPGAPVPPSPGPGGAPPAFGAPRPPMGGPGGPPPPGAGGFGAPPPPMGAAAPMMGAPPGMAPPGPGMGGMGGMGAMGGGMAPPGMAPMGMGSLSAVMDAFETLSLGGGGAPGMPGAPAAPPANAATFPRPAGTPEQEAAAVGPPPPYSQANCGPAFLRMTTQAAPNSQALKTQWHLPLGAVVHPLAESGGQVGVANAGSPTIVRCKRCRTYMNPFMTWLDGGRRFTCNVCAMVNETPVEYFCALDASGRRIDADQRPELSSGSVEYIAPAEYMVRPPMPPTFVFVIDVSFAAAASGMIAAACAGIKACLDRLPGEDRTRVAVITFDSAIHYYNLRAGLSAPQMMVVPEIDDPFVPLPDELLVNLSESRAQVERLLDTIPASFAANQRVDSAMGPALQAAFLVMSSVGGKLLLFQAATPSAGIGKVKARDNPALYGTDREYALRSPDDPFYKRFSAEASRFQICVDVFAGGSAYQDLPSLGALPKYTGGQLYYYPGFAADRDGAKLAAEIERNLTRETAWEAVMRIRCSKGLRIASFMGHFFVRSTDLLALPACDADKTFAVEIQHEETVLSGQTAYIQAALLYTSSQGERRIRVHTAAIPVVSDLLELYKASDAGATATLLAKTAVERSLSAKLDEVRAGVQARVASALREYRMLHMRGMPGGGPPPSSLVLPERLKSLPVLTLGLLKTAALRGGGRDVNTDERAAVGAQIMIGPVTDLVRLAYPAAYRVDDPSGGWGRPGADGGAVALPPTAPAGLEYFDPTGAYLIDNSRVMVLWLGSATPQGFYQAVLGPQAGPHNAGGFKVEPARQGSDLSARLCAVVEALRAGRELRQEVHVVVQGTPPEAHVMPYFVEDRLAIAGGLPGYLEWVMTLQKQVMAK